MIIFPAVDIKDGRCVRLKQGKAEEVTVFADDPIEPARKWAGLGAQWLHVIDLDGAFSGMPKNFELISRLCAEVRIPVQLGGGVRDLDTARNYIKAGVSRLIIGTLALENPDGFGAMCADLPGRIGVSLDAVDGQLKTRGWVADAGLTVFDVLPRLEAQGAAFIIYTDIGRDGMQTGTNLPALERLLEATKLPVLIAGGIATLDDIKALQPYATRGLEGIITGRAIYAGSLDFVEALDWLAAQNN